MALLPFVRLTVGGHMDASNQTWSFGTSWGLTSLPTPAQLFTWLGLVSPLVTSYINATSGPKSCWGANTTYDTLQCYAYDANATSAGSQAAIVVTPIVGATSPSLPTQLAVVHSLLSAFPGRKNRGRYYMPFTGNTGAFGTNGQLSTTQAAAYSTTGAAFLRSVALTSIGTQPAIPVIATRGSSPYVLVSSVNVDSKIDTQRRRTDKEAAAFHTITAL